MSAPFRCQVARFLTSYSAMKTHRITAVLTLAAIASITACSGDVTAADTGDALALDSMLQKQVLMAQGDSVPAIEEVQEVIRPLGPVPRATSSAAPAPSEPARAPSAAPSATTPRPSALPARQPEIARPRPEPPKPASVAAATRSAPATVERKPAPPRTTATVPAGTRLSLVSGQRVCVTTARVGERIPARTASRLTGPLGTVIPAGAPATVVVTSLTGPLGEERILIDVRAISVGGTSYRVSSQVTDIELDRRAGAERCIPSGGEIEARLTSALRISDRG